MSIIYIDGKKYKVNESNNLLQECLNLGFDIPYFCWHPVLGSVGACRQCAIKKYKNINDKNGQIVMSCMTPSIEGSIISITSNEARKFRKNIIEYMMINHPHDCPICEEGGNCHLQDMTVMSKHIIRRYRFKKRTYVSQYLGPFISHEMNRCISCYRCVRYYKDYADGNDFDVYGSHDNVYFGRFENGDLDSEFSGNLIEICPTGVFTDKISSKNFNRKWDIQFAPTICQQCSLGCNTISGERNGKLCKVENRYNGNINHYFLCDLGRFGYEYVNLENRPRQPLQKKENNWIKLSANQIIHNTAKILRNSNKIIGIGSPRASIESNFALRELVGSKNFYTGISKNEQDILLMILKILYDSGIHTPSIKEIESYDTILILGEDLTQTGSRMALAVRQAIKNISLRIAKEKKIDSWNNSAILNVNNNIKNSLFITNIDCTKLDDISTWSYYATVDDQAKLGFAIANSLDKKAPQIFNLNNFIKNKIKIISKALKIAKKPLIITGSSSRSKSIIASAANIAIAIKKKYNNNVGISFIASDVNSIGLAMIGGKNLDEAFNTIENNVVNSVIVLENDLYRHASSVRIDSAIKKINNLILIDHKYTDLQKKANFIFSASSFAEGNGTVVNQEGRAQRFFQVYDPSYYDDKIIILDSWNWLYSLKYSYLNNKVKWTNLDDILNNIIINFPNLFKIKDASPNANFRINGQKLSRQSHRYSGRTAICSNIRIHESRIPQDKNSMFTFSMEGNNEPKSPRNQIAFVWSPGWNSPQAWNKFQNEIGGHLLYGDPGIKLIKTYNKKLNYFKNIPSELKLNNNKSWKIAPYWHLFGKDETSQCSPAILNKMVTPYVSLNKIDAINLKIDNGKFLSFNCNDMKFCLPVKLSNFLNSGQIGLPIGFPGIPPFLIGQNAFNLREVIK